MSRSIHTNFDALKAPMHPRKLRRIAYIAAYSAELQARERFRQNDSAANLTAWADARNELEDKKAKL